jgi:hypothetical protein
MRPGGFEARFGGMGSPCVARTGLSFATGTGQPGQPALSIDIPKDLCATERPAVRCDLLRSGKLAH